MAEDAALTETAAQIDAALLPHLDGATRYALLDFPDHPNIGDCCIYTGEAAFLARRFGAGPVLVTTCRSPISELAHLPEDCVILLHGGGNFGDVWPRYQAYREAVMAACPNHRILQLPQSIHFTDTAARDRTARAIAAHGNVTLFVRDRPSHAFAGAHFDCETVLCPDMAFAQHPVTPPRVATAHETLCLLRLDKERHPEVSPETFADIGTLADWPGQLDPAQRAALALARKLPAGGAAMRLRAAIFDRFARTMVARGFRTLAGAEVVVTDRLHGHIMSSLIGKRHVALDNFYGKIGNFIDAWPKDSVTRRATTLAEVRAALEDLR